MMENGHNKLKRENLPAFLCLVYLKIDAKSTNVSENKFKKLQITLLKLVFGQDGGNIICLTQKSGSEL